MLNKNKRKQWEYIKNKQPRDNNKLINTLHIEARTYIFDNKNWISALKILYGTVDNNYTLSRQNIHSVVEETSMESNIGNVSSL